jgi:hypothetical protein
MATSVEYPYARAESTGLGVSRGFWRLTGRGYRRFCRLQIWFRRRGVLRVCSASRTYTATATAAYWVGQHTLNGAIVRGLPVLCVAVVLLMMGEFYVLG